MQQKKKLIENVSIGVTHLYLDTENKFANIQIVLNDSLNCKLLSLSRE